MTYVVSKCEEKEVLQQVDWGALDMLAENYDTFLRCNLQVRQDGLMIEGKSGYLEKHPLIKVANDAQIQAVKLMLEFGLTPKSRERVKALQVGDDSSNDPLSKYI